MQYHKIIIGLFFLFIYTFDSYGQRDVSEAIGTPYIGLQYGANWTAGDLAERYGFTNSLGAHAGYKTKKNWIFGIEGNFLFGNNIRIDRLLDNLRDSRGEILNTSGQPSIVVFYNRGFNVNFAISKIIPVLSPNPNSGIMIQLGAGYLWHKLRIEAQEDEVPQISGDYLKGYDRLTIGMNVSEFIGYNYMANQGIWNFYAGFYAMHGFTKNQRDVFWDHPNEKVDKGLRIEHIIGFKVGWLIPIYKREVKEFYYN